MTLLIQLDTLVNKFLEKNIRFKVKKLSVKNKIYLAD